MHPSSRALVPLFIAVLLSCSAGCAASGSGSTVTELRAGTMCAGSTTETEGSISVTHFWTVELTQHDAVFTYDERRVVLENVVGTKPLTCRGNQSTGKRPDVVLELDDGSSARWKGLSIEVGSRLYEITGPGTFVIDANGTMKRR
jgi:hypothetical protein